MKTEDGLGKPSMMSNNGHFANVTIAIAHADPKAALVVKAVLDSLGCRATLLVRDGPELLSRVAKEPVDLAVIDSMLRTVTGVETVALLRRSENMSTRDLPVILLDSTKEHAAIEAARDAGVTEYVLKPFTARTLLASVHSIVESPRPFVISKDYVGPDRRIRSSFTTLLPASPRGTCTRRSHPVAEQAGEPVTHFGRDEPRIIVPDYRLKRKMGLSVPEPLVTSPETIEKLERTMEAAKVEYAMTVRSQVREIIAYNRLLVQKPDRADLTVASISSLAAAIESNTGDLGFKRIPEVARLLREFCNKFYTPGDARSLILLEKHALTLLAMLQGGPRMDTGVAGESLVKDLARQVATFRKT